MNNETPSPNPASGAAIGFIIASLIFIVLVVIVKFSVSVPAIDADRATGISRALHEIHTNEFESLNHVGWVDQQRGIVRLPIETALHMIEKQTPESAHANLIWREEQANAPLPKQPAKANPFE